MSTDPRRPVIATLASSLGVPIEVISGDALPAITIDLDPFGDRHQIVHYRGHRIVGFIDVYEGQRLHREHGVNPNHWEPPIILRGTDLVAAVITAANGLRRLIENGSDDAED